MVFQKYFIIPKQNLTVIVPLTEIGPPSPMLAGELCRNAIKILANHSTSACFDGQSQISIICL